MSHTRRQSLKPSRPPLRSVAVIGKYEAASDAILKYLDEYGNLPA